MFQQQAPVVVVMNCSASACQFPNDSVVRQSTLEIALATAFGVALVLLIAMLIVFCMWHSRRLERSYAQFGGKKRKKKNTNFLF